MAGGSIAADPASAQNGYSSLGVPGASYRELSDDALAIGPGSCTSVALDAMCAQGSEHRVYAKTRQSDPTADRDLGWRRFSAVVCTETAHK